MVSQTAAICFDFSTRTNTFNTYNSILQIFDKASCFNNKTNFKLTGLFLQQSIYISALSFPRPIGMWKFDYIHGRVDVSGNGNDISISNMPQSRDNPFDYYNAGK